MANLSADERLEKIKTLSAMNAAFLNEQFGEYKAMIGEDGYYLHSPYPAPPVYPKKNEHPRLLMTPALLPRVKQMLEEPMYRNIRDNLEELARADVAYGIFPETVGKLGGVYRYSASVLSAIETKAFMYMLTGDELYALEAIVGIKNAMLTLKFTKDIHGDTYHGASHVLFVLSFVLDRCHDYLTDADKEQFMRGAVSLLMPCLEFEYPPSNFRGISGHGTGPQFLRDFMTLATAFYDEAPDWWEFVAGRYFSDFLPTANATFGKGWVSQGTGNYAYNKLLSQLFAATLVYNATGYNPIDEGIGQGIRFLVSHSMPSGLYFETGDGARTRNGAARSVEFGSFFLTASLFDDSVAFANAREKSDGFKKYLGSFSSTMTPAMQISLLSRVHYDGSGARDGMPLVQYFAEPAGQMTARNSWTSADAAIAFMKIGNLNMANHDHSDHGTFQIYYKGLLACASGAYRKYHSYHHKFYQKSTVSANGLLVFNPALADSEPVYAVGEDGKPERTVLKNPERYYYSGSQRLLKEAGTVEELFGGGYDMGRTTGADTGYNGDGAALFGYIAGDITNAYDSETVDYVGRRMLCVYTGKSEYPMLFFTFDTLDSTDAAFEKTFLLHTADEPTVNAAELSATVTENGGKLEYFALFGADSVTKLGGAGYAYWINGKNCVDNYTKEDNAEKIWGRIEVKTSGEKHSQLLSAMYVTDRENENRLAFEKYESAGAYAACTLDVAAIFAKSEPLASDAFDLALPEGKELRCFVSGLAAGEWQVKVDGRDAVRLQVEEGRGFASFVATSGKIEFIPKAKAEEKGL